jgi:hypothetical protein
MNKKELLKMVMDFCFEYGVFKEPLTERDIERLESELKECKFVEWLIGIVIINTKGYRDRNYHINKTLYLKLNDLRFDLEFKR